MCAPVFPEWRPGGDLPRKPTLRIADASREPAVSRISRPTAARATICRAASPQAHSPKMANGLHEQRDDNASEGRGVVSKGPDHHEDPESADDGSDHKQPNFVVAERKRHSGQQSRLPTTKRCGCRV